jgi:hypothetical protein
MSVFDLPALCQGGPHDGGVLPARLVPWLVWVPRVGWVPGPPVQLTREEAFAVGHYEYAGVRKRDEGPCRVYQWCAPRISSRGARPRT